MKKEVLLERYKNKRRIIFGIALIILIFLYLFRNTSLLIRSFSAIGLLLLFYTTDHLFDLNFKNRHYIFIFIIALTGFLLAPLYFLYEHYDKIQHFLLPMMFASIVLHMLKGLRLQLKWKLFFTFFIVAGFLGIFEIGEYLLDAFFDLKLQGVFLKNLQGELISFDIIQHPLDDTMLDLSLGVIGTAIYSVMAALWHNKKK
jgi:hypothetical protein